MRSLFARRTPAIPTYPAPVAIETADAPDTIAPALNRVPAPRYESGVDTSFAIPEQTFMHALNLMGAPVAVHHHEHRYTSNVDGQASRDIHEVGYRWVCTGCGLFGGEKPWWSSTNTPERSLSNTIAGANAHAGECRFPVQTSPAKL
jgi:hypothetical protein